jgi:hypothetical protein
MLINFGLRRFSAAFVFGVYKARPKSGGKAPQSKRLNSSSSPRNKSGAPTNQLLGGAAGLSFR